MLAMYLGLASPKVSLNLQTKDKGCQVITGAELTFVCNQHGWTLLSGGSCRD